MRDRKPLGCSTFLSCLAGLSEPLKMLPFLIISVLYHHSVSHIQMSLHEARKAGRYGYSIVDIESLSRLAPALIRDASNSDIPGDRLAVLPQL